MLRVVVVVDTGSRDGTVALAESLGARVFDFPWVDDFAAARNAALARATGDYAFWLDADDRLGPDQWPVLKALLDGLDDSPVAHVVKCSCDSGHADVSPTVVDHVRLFPLRPDVRWTYRVHEQILPALRRAGVEVRWSDVTVRHVGYVDPSVRARKLERDERILKAEALDRPEGPFVLFNLGGIAHERGDHALALDWLTRSLAGSAPTDSITRKLHVLIARSHQGLGDLPGALRACDEGLALDANDAELWFRRGMVSLDMERWSEAESAFERTLATWSAGLDRFGSVDAGIGGHLTHRHLARLAKGRGALEKALWHWRAVLAERPDDPEARSAL